MANQKHSSLTPEHYTPSYIVEAARATMGSIDLDPASCDIANRTVRANVFFSHQPATSFWDGTKVVQKEHSGINGLAAQWHGNVFLNPPGGVIDGASAPVLWFEKLVDEFRAGNIHQAVFVAFSLEFLQTVQLSHAMRYARDAFICISKRRVKYLRADGTEGGSPPGASAILYIGPNRSAFVENFGGIGMVLNT